MRTARWVVACAALLLCATPQASAHPAQSRHQLPDRIDLPDGWQPEGITTDGRRLYVGSLADGALWKANPRTGSGRILEPGVAGRVAVGVDYDRRRDLLWVAGGATNEIRAHDADTGDVVATYLFPSATARFLNDLVVTPKAVYATDSMNQELAVVPLGRGRHLPSADRATTLPLTGDLVYQSGFNLNGIVKSRHWLLAVQSNTGQLFRINPWSGSTMLVDLGGASLSNGDGLEIRGDILYVVRNQLNLVAVVDLDRRRTSGEYVDELTDPGLDVPTTVALVRCSLYAVNARFGTPPTPDTDYWITRLHR